MRKSHHKVDRPGQFDVCVGISIYRQRHAWLQAAVESVIAQSLSTWQLLIRPDGPNSITNESLNWLKELAANDNRVYLIEGEERLGTFASYRLIFSQTKAKYLVQLDADDKLHPDALKNSTQLLNSNHVSSFVYTKCTLIDDNNIELGLDKRALRTWSKYNDLVQFIPFHMRLIRRSAYVKVGGYDSNFYYTGDYDLSLKLSEHANPLYLPEPLYYYRLHSSSESQKKRKLTHQEAVRAARNALRRRGMVEKHVLIHTFNPETVTLANKTRGPVIIAGMHRSGTSLLARMLNRLGVNFSSDLLPKDVDNPDGYQEDNAFLSLQRRWFSESIVDNQNGWRDWGWNSIQSISSLGHASWKNKAKQLLNHRENNIGSGRWGWKDPRTTLLLPFWRHLRPELMLVGIYRAPWDISDALQRLRHSQFRTHPEMILPLWQLYNKRIVEYLEAEPERCILVNAESLASSPEVLPHLTEDRWDWRCEDKSIEDELKEMIRPERLQRISLPDPIETLYSLVYPEIHELWCLLQKQSDLSRDYKSSANHSLLSLNKKPINDPMLCVVIPTYNPTHTLIEAIASVERNRNKETCIELIIVDDGSTLPGSLALLEGLRLAGYNIISQTNSGLAAARNTGIGSTTAGLILPLDDDNRLLSLYLNKGLEYMIGNVEVDVFYSDRIDFGAIHQLFRPGAIDSKDLVRTNRVDACAVFRRQLWIDCGGYDEKLEALEDWDLWLSGLSRGMKTCYAPEPGFEYRVRESSMLRRHLADAKAHRLTIEYLRSKHGLPIQSLIVNQGW